MAAIQLQQRFSRRKQAAKTNSAAKTQQSTTAQHHRPQHKAPKHATRGGPRTTGPSTAVCTLKCILYASRILIYPHPLPQPYNTKDIQSLEQFKERNAKSLREEIEQLCTPVLEGVLVGVKVKSTILGRHSRYGFDESGYKIKITITDKAEAALVYPSLWTLLKSLWKTPQAYANGPQQ